MREKIIRVISWGLCVLYSFLVIVSLLWKCVRSGSLNPLRINRRDDPPECLQSKQYGEHKFIKVNGIRLHYVEKGDRTKPLIIFLHGFPEFWYSWRYQLKEFSNDYWTIAIDMRGYNLSDKPKSISDYKINNMVEDVRAFVDAMDRKKFTLIAHDWGAVIGWRFIALHADMLDRYVMMSAGSTEAMGTLINSTITQFLKSWYIFMFHAPYVPEMFVGQNDLDALKMINDFKFDDNFTRDDLEAFKYTFSKPSGLRSPINYYRATSFMGERVIARGPYPPGLFMIGETDKYISHANGPLMVKYMRNLEFKIVKGANHFMQQTKPIEVNRLLREFMKTSMK